MKRTRALVSVMLPLFPLAFGACSSARESLVASDPTTPAAPSKETVVQFQGSFDAATRKLTFEFLDPVTGRMRPEATLPYGGTSATGATSGDVLFHTCVISPYAPSGAGGSLSATVEAVNNTGASVGNLTVVIDAISDTGTTFSTNLSGNNYGTVTSTNDHGCSNNMATWKFTQVTSTNFSFIGHATGLAQASVLVPNTNLGSFSSVVVDPSGANVYWATEGSEHLIHKYNVAGKSDSPFGVTFGAGYRPFAIATDSTYVYISDEGGDSLIKQQIASPYAATIVSGSNGGEGRGIAADATNLYWCSDPGGSSAPTLLQYALSGLNGSSVPKTLYSGIRSTNYCYGLALDSTTAATTVFWVDQTAGTVNAARVGVANSNVVLVTGETQASGIVTDGTRIYWGDNTAGGTITIKYATIPSPLAAIAPAAITTLYTTTTASGTLSSMALNGSNVYFNERSTSASNVYSVPLTGGAATALTTNGGLINTIAIGTGPSASQIFWSTSSSNPPVPGLWGGPN